MPLLRRRREDKRAKKRERAYGLLEEIDEQKVAPTVIIREKEIVKEDIKMANCCYCGALMPATSVKCEHCGALRKK